MSETMRSNEPPKAISVKGVVFEYKIERSTDDPTTDSIIVCSAYGRHNIAIDGVCLEYAHGSLADVAEWIDQAAAHKKKQYTFLIPGLTDACRLTINGLGEWQVLIPKNKCYDKPTNIKGSSEDDFENLIGIKFSAIIGVND